jgi:hypothetical protein
MANLLPSVLTLPSTAAATDDQDDLSTSTVAAGSTAIRNRTEKKEYVIKFLFRPANTNNNAEVARIHFAILETIHEIYHETTTIFDNYGSRLKDFSTPLSYDAYLRHFKVLYAKPNPKKNRSAIYICYHRIQSSIPISEIRRNYLVSTLLQKVNTRMSIHQWKEDDTHISTLGFFVGVDPSNHLSDELTSRLRTFISKKVNCRVKNIPEFKLVFSSPFVMNVNKTRISTKSYDLQVRQTDAKEMIRLLREAYAADPTFIFHKVRHKNIVTYCNAIRKQNAFLRDSRIVPIHGISEDLMFAFDLELKQVPGVQDVFRHKTTATTGRWNILTTEQEFKKVTDSVTLLLKTWIPEHAHEYLSDDSFPAPGLAFRNQQYESDSDHSFQTYMSACSSLYHHEDMTSPDEPPATTLPIAQAWGGTIPKFLAPTVQTPVSGMSQEYEKLQQENDALRKEVTEMKQILLTMQQQQAQQPMDMQQLVAAAAQVAMQLMTIQQNSSFSTSATTPAPAPPPRGPPMTPPPPKRQDTKPSPMLHKPSDTSTSDANNLSQDDDL